MDLENRVGAGSPLRRGLAALLAAAFCASALGAQGAGGSRVDYVIHARLDGETKRLTGTETLRWRNETSETTSELQFHLYLNAFSNNYSTHLVEAKGKLRGHHMKSGWGWSRITGANLLETASGSVLDEEPETTRVDLFPTLTYLAPDDGREEDRTVFSLALPRAVGPGETVEVEIEWESQLPRVRRRTGYKDDFLLVAHWFPKLGVLEDGRGWNTHQFHANTEFYSDYGTYDVTLDLPAVYRGEATEEPLVGGSGVIQSSELKGDERLMVRFVAPSPEDQRHEDRTGHRALVHDFTWTADPDFVVHRETFRSSTWATEFPKEVEAAREAFGDEVDLQLHNVDIRVLIHPERVDQAERHARATAAGLFFYGLWFGEYPYSHVTVVDPAWGARAAGGMEYPTLFTCGTRLFTTPDMYVPESVTVHEVGHQFWYGLVGNNEFEAAWMDEGFNSYTDSEVLWRVYGPRRRTTDYAGFPLDGERFVALPGGGSLQSALIGAKVPIPFSSLVLEPFRPSSFLQYWRDLPELHLVSRHSDPRWSDRGGYLRSPDRDAIDTPAWEHSDRRSYSTNSYPRTAVVLRTLRGLVGEAAFLRGMRHYAETYRYGHPYPDDFFRAFEEGSGIEQDLSWFWKDFFRGTDTGNWSVHVTQAKEAKPRGYFADPETGEFVKVGSKEPEEDVAESEDGEEPAGPPWVTEVLVRKRGGLELPLDVRVEFENGEKDRYVWTRQEQLDRPWLRRVYVGPSKVVSVVLDPADKIWIDTDMSDNQWYAERDHVAPWRWSERSFSQVARVLQWFSRLGG